MSAPREGIRLIMKRGIHKRIVDVPTGMDLDAALEACLRVLAPGEKPAKTKTPAE